jgi:hypothetical protein
VASLPQQKPRLHQQPLPHARWSSRRTVIQGGLPPLARPPGQRFSAGCTAGHYGLQSFWITDPGSPPSLLPHAALLVGFGAYGYETFVLARERGQPLRSEISRHPDISSLRWGPAYRAGCCRWPELRMRSFLGSALSASVVFSFSQPGLRALTHSCSASSSSTQDDRPQRAPLHRAELAGPLGTDRFWVA